MIMMLILCTGIMSVHGFTAEYTEGVKVVSLTYNVSTTVLTMVVDITPSIYSANDLSHFIIEGKVERSFEINNVSISIMKKDAVVEVSDEAVRVTLTIPLETVMHSENDLPRAGEIMEVRAGLYATGSQSGANIWWSQTQDLTVGTAPLDDSMEIALSPETFVYSGQSCKPTVTVVTAFGKTLKDNRDYKVIFENNVDVGTATAVVTGTGNYTGSVRKTFSITARPDPDRNVSGKTSGGGSPPAVETDVYGNVIMSEAQKERQIQNQKNDKDTLGSTYSLLQARTGRVTRNSVTIRWKRIAGATKYVIFGNKCGRGNPYLKLAAVSGTTYTQKKLKKGAYYKFFVVAAGSGKALATSKTIHVATSGGKFGNDKAVKVNKSKVTLKRKKSVKIKATAIPQSEKLKVRHHRKISFETSDPKVAAVTKSGKIKAIRKGKCVIYAYAQNGVMKAIRVTVK